VPWRSRSLLLALLSVGYVLVAALRVAPGGAAALVGVLLLPLTLLIVWARSVPPARGEDWVNPVTRSATRAVGYGSAVMAAARLAPPGVPFLEALAALGTGIASIASLVALVRIAPLGGLLTVPRSARQLRLAMLSGLIAALAASAPFEPSIAASSVFSGFPTTQAIGALSATAALALGIYAAWHLRRKRRLDLGASERLSAALVAASVALLIGFVAALERIESAAPILQWTACLAALATVTACLARDPTAVARAHRTTVAITVLAAPTALFVASIATHVPRQAELTALLALGAGVAIGLGAIPLSRPFGPEQSRWIDATKGAFTVALRSDPDTAVTAALATLRQALGPSPAAPELWRLDPPSLLTADRAGYGRSEPGAAPPRLLFELARGEPEQTLRTEVLETLEVRRADVRPALDWLRGRGAMSLTLLTDDEGPVGALVLPAGARAHPLSLEEVRALRTLADRMTAQLGVSGALARARTREVEARRSAERETERAALLEKGVMTATRRHEANARRLARPALVAPYSPVARLTMETLERAAESAAPLSLLTPPGMDPVPYAAVVHSASPRREGPFVVVDGAGVDEQQEESWRDPIGSPLHLAQGGSLLVLSIAALAPEAQRFLATALATREPLQEGAARLDLALIVAVPMTLEKLVEAGELDAGLVRALGDRAVDLPPLAARAEDMRAIIVDRLARLGLRIQGRPMGLDPRALGRLIEHAWPGNELELEDLLTRAIAIAEGDLLTAAHLEQVGFVAAPPTTRRSSRPSIPRQAARS
jgi:transcriptional regulator with AAA-type ATPase domain